MEKPDLLQCGVGGVDSFLADLLLPENLIRESLESCAKHNNLEAVKLIHHHGSKLSEGLFTTRVMDVAAGAGAIGVVKFLHENRTEGCTHEAMELAAHGRFLDVVTFLYETRQEACTQRVVQAAASPGLRKQDPLALLGFLLPRCVEELTDPTSWSFVSNTVMKYVCFAWVKSATLTGDPIRELRASVFKLTDIEEFKVVHDRTHAVACASRRGPDQRSLLSLAIGADRIEFAVYLVANCEHARDSITADDLIAVAGTETSLGRLNDTCLGLMLASRPRGVRGLIVSTEFLAHAVKHRQFVLAMLLLDDGVPCTEGIMSLAISYRGDDLKLVDHLLKQHPELVTLITLQDIVESGDYDFFYKLHASHGHLCREHVLALALTPCTEDEPAVWKFLHFMHQHHSAMPLAGDFAELWHSGEWVLVFMWLMWPDPIVATSLMEAPWKARICFYSFLRKHEPSLFANIPASLPWCCQLRVLRERFQSGALTLADMTHTRSCDLS